MPEEPTMLEGRDIVCISSLDWRAMWTSKQQLMHRLAQTNRVLYVEEPVTMLAPLRVPSRWRRWASVVPRLERVDTRLWTLALPPLLPFGNMRPRLNGVNQAIIARYVRWALGRLRFEEGYILWAYLPTSVGLLDRLGTAAANRETAATGRAPAPQRSPRRERDPRPGLVLYHCVDEHSAFPGFVAPEVVKGYDDELTRRADLVVTTSENLRGTRLPLNPHTYTVLNAVDVDIFSRALDPAVPLPADLSSIPAPRLGVVGLHDSRLDVDALERLSEADGSWQIVLVGPIKPGQVDEARLRRHRNIHLLGEKPRPELPAYLKGFATALVPYRSNELTRNIFPLKLFEYLAAGLPVVAGNLPELRRLGEFVALAGGPDDYPGLVRAAIAEDSPEKRAARVALAAENTWDHRAHEISRLAEKALERLATGSG